MSDGKKICCALDVSEPSRLAFAEAVALAARLWAKLTLVHVHASQVPIASALLATSRGTARDWMGMDEEILDAWREEAARRLGVPVEQRVLLGDPATEIARLAREESFDLLVVGSHDGAGLGRLVLGSVADRIAREAPCPVLVARRRERGEAAEIAAEAALYR